MSGATTRLESSGMLGARRQRGKLRRHLAGELRNVDVARRQHQSRIGVVAQRQQHVLERHLGVAVRTRVVGRPRQ